MANNKEQDLFRMNELEADVVDVSTLDESSYNAADEDTAEKDTDVVDAEEASSEDADLNEHYSGRAGSVESEKRFFKIAKEAPLLSPEEELQLWKTIKEGGKAAEEASEKLITSHYRKAISMAKKYSSNYSGSYWDFIEAGCLGLVDAVRSFDPEKGKNKAIEKAQNGAKLNGTELTEEKIKEIEKNGGRFETHAKGYIRKYMLALCKEKADIKTDDDNKFRNAVKRVNDQIIGREPTDVDYLKNIKHEGSTLSEYDFVLNELKELYEEDAYYEVSEEDVLRASEDFLRDVHAALAWMQPHAGIINPEGETIDIEDTKESKISLTEKEEKPRCNLSAIELLALRYKDMDAWNSYITNNAASNMFELFGYDEDDINEIYERAIRKMIIHKSDLKRDEDEDEYEDGKVSSYSDYSSYWDDNDIDAEITKHMKNLVDEMCSDFWGMFTKEELNSRFALMKSTEAGRLSTSFYWRKELIKDLRVSGNKLTDKATDEEIRDAINNMPDRIEIIETLIDKLYENYRSFPTSMDYITRIIDCLGCDCINKSYDKDEKTPDSIRVAIVKQFLATTDYGVTKSGKNTYSVPKLIKKLNPELKGCDDKDPKLISAADERLFDEYDNMSEDSRKRHKLLKLANSIQSGVFKTEHRTKKELYLIAFAFGMQAFEKRGKGVAGYNPIIDIEKNLFEDYYNNDFTKYLIDAPKSSYEHEPEGDGINYKNFAELIYIYYLNREDLTAAEKINRAEALIDACVSEAKESGTLAGKTTKEESKTSLFKNDIWKLIRENASEDEVKEHVLNNCLILENAATSDSEMSSADNSVTSTEYTEEFLKKVLRNYERISESHNNLLDFIMDHEDKSKKHWDEFIKLLERMNALIDINRLIDKPRGQSKYVMCTESEDFNPKRLKLLVAAYYAYQFDDDPQGYSFSELFDSFASYVDEALIESRYQGLSSKNIFDVYLVLVMYYAANVL